MIAEKVKLLETDFETVCAFIDDMNLREGYRPDGLEERLSEIRNHGEAWVVSELGPIEDGKLKLITGLYAPLGGADSYSPTEPVAFWYPDYAVRNYLSHLSLAHERKVRQLRHFMAKRTAV